MLTQNLYLGADLSPVLTASTREELSAALQRGVFDLEDADNAGRIEAAAGLIAAAQPDLVGLQEVTVWRRGEAIIHDWGAELQSLLPGYRLAGRWRSNRVAVAGGPQTSMELGNAVLARESLGELSPLVGDYEAKLTVTSPLLGAVTLRRGWVAVDGSLEGRPYRFLTTHLEASLLPFPESVPVQVTQAAELTALAAAVAAERPVIAVGDFNSDPAAEGVIPSASRDNLVRAGFVDAWASLRGSEPGLTWRIDDEIRKEDALLGARLDLVLILGEARPVSVEVLGDDPAVRTASGRWISDHLAVLAEIEFQ